MRAILVVLVVLLSAPLDEALSQATGEAPFGLTWGASTQQLQAQGITLTEMSEQTSGKTYKATNLPKIVSDAELIVLSFGWDDKLWRVAALGSSRSNDPYGSAIKSRYEELAAALAEKYGKGKQEHFRAQGYETNYFLMGIKGGNNWWYTNYSNAAVTVQLGLGATDSSTGFWRLIYNSKALAAAFEKAKKEREKGAL